MSLRIDRHQFGDIQVSRDDERDLTVADLIEALGHMPADARVRRYAREWGVEGVSYSAGEHAVDLD